MKRMGIVTAAMTVTLTGPTAMAVQGPAKGYFCGGERATIVGTTGHDVLLGTTGHDVIVGLGGNDYLNGRAGDDLLCGGNGGDRINGGPGDDVLWGGGPVLPRGRDNRPSDQLNGGPDDDVMVAGAREISEPPTVISYEMSTVGVTADLGSGTVTGWGDDLIVGGPPGHQILFTGSRYDDQITGSEGFDEVRGGRGDDALLGLGGRDRLSGGEGADDLQGGAGDDVLSAGTGFDLVHGGDGRDLIRAADLRADDLFGDGGNDFVEVSTSDSPDWVLDGGPGHDRLDLQWTVYDGGVPVPAAVTTDMVAETFVFDDSAVTFPIRSFEAMYLWGRGSWTAWGSDGPDLYTAGSAVRLTAHLRGGDDSVYGSDRADLVDGGPGSDIAWTYRGADTCISIEETHSCETSG